MKKALSVLCMSAGLLVSGVAMAVSTSAPAAYPCGVTDVTAYNGSAFVANAVQCWGGIGGNLNATSDVASVIGTTLYSQFSSYVFQNSEYFATNIFDNNPGGISGSLQFDNIGGNPNTAYYGDFLLGLKAGNFFSLYRFTIPSASIGFTHIDFDTDGIVGPQSLALSHAGLIGGLTERPFTPPPPPPPAVPEAETYAMLLGGLGLIGFMARRRQKSMKVTFA